MTRQEALQKARAAQRNNVAELAPPRPKIETPGELNKMYHFQLCKEFPMNWKPVDKATGKPMTPPYPKHYTIPNEGIAYDEDYIDPDTNEASPRAREWRYIEGQPSIWADEQLGLANMDERTIQKMLGDDRNRLEFEYGQLNVRGIEKLKMKALQIQDIFEGKKVRYTPKIPIYRLNNPDAIVSKDLNWLSKEYMTMKIAQECTVEHMLECCYVMGIDIDDQSDSGLNRIKLEFLKKAKYDDANPDGLEWFTSIVNSPVTHATYVFAQGLSRGIISTVQQPGKLTWAKANQVIMDMYSSDPVEALCADYLSGKEQVIKIMAEIEKQLN